MGNEIKRDECPEKYYGKGSLVKNILPVIIALVIVSFFSGSMFIAAGIDTLVVLLIEVPFVFIMSACFFFTYKRQNKRLSEIYISVCENGVCGVCFKNTAFELQYSEITKLTVKKDYLYLYSKKGMMLVVLKDAAGTAELIRSKNGNL